jgi:branched-chain amino acid transport system permease protein
VAGDERRGTGVSLYWSLVAIGLFTGSIYGLGALGLVLTYKTTGVFNFAYGAVAMFCAYVYWQLHDDSHITAWIALPLLVLVVAPVIGLLFEALFRPLAGLSAEIPIVVTLALLAFFVQAATSIWGGQAKYFQSIIPTSTFRLGSFHVGYDQLGTLVILIISGIGLWWLLRHTRFGTATRAVVDNGDLASMIGVSAPNVRRSAWAVSSIFAALVGVLLSHSQTLTPNNLVLVALAATTPAVLARLTSFPWAFGGALGIGVLFSLLTKVSTSGWVANVISSGPWLLLLLFLVVLGRQLKEAGISVRPMGGGTSAAVASGSEGSTRWRAQRAAVAGVAAFVLAVLLPTFLNGSDVGNLTDGAIWALIAVTLVVLTGWAGQISLCQFTFVGVGAFAIGHLAGAHGGNFVAATLAGMGIAGALGLVVGAIAVRLKGLYLALATLAVALIFDSAVFQTVGISGGFTGIFDHRPHIAGVSFVSTTSLYELCVCVLGVVLAAAFLISRGPVGRRLLILRDSPLAASTLGVNLTVTKLVTFALCSVVASLGGALYGVYLQSITPLSFNFQWSLALLLYVVFAGRTRLSAAVLTGALAMVQPFAHNPTVFAYLQLGVAVGVVGLGRVPEGTIALSMQEAKRTLSVMRPRPRRSLDFELMAHRPAEVRSGA